MTSYELVKKLGELNNFIQSKGDLLQLIQYASRIFDDLVGETNTPQKSSKHSGVTIAARIFKTQVLSGSLITTFANLLEITNQLKNLGKTYPEFESLYFVGELKNSIFEFTRFIERIIKYETTVTLSDFYKCWRLADYIDGIRDLYLFLNKNLLNSLEPSENEVTFTLTLDTIKNYKDLTQKLVAIEVLYSELCSLFKISESEFPLKIRKVETGSAVIDLIGNAVVLGCIVWFVKEGIKFLYRNYTYEGKIASIPRQLEAADSILQFTKKLEEAGLDVAENQEEIKKVAVRVTENLNTLLANQAKIKIDDQEISVGDELEEKFLKDNEQLLLGEGDQPE